MCFKSIPERGAVPLRIYFKIRTFSKVYCLRSLNDRSRISDLKEEVEILTGIPSEIQKIYFLDRDAWIINESMVEVGVLGDLEPLIFSAIAGNIIEIFNCYKNLHKHVLLRGKKRKLCLTYGEIVLLVAVSFDHRPIVLAMLNKGVSVSTETRLRRGVLHVAAANNRTDLIPVLLKSGADPSRKDVEGLSAEAIATIYDFKGFADDLFVRRWYLRAKAMIPEHLNPPMMAFQMYDSKYPTWFYGDYGQIYLQKLAPAGEFLGTGLSAPRTKKTPVEDCT